MKKFYSCIKFYCFFIFLLLSSNNILAQFSTETFETESSGSNNFTDNGVVFNIISHNSTFKIINGPAYGWSGTTIDNQYIDNTGNSKTNASFSIKTTSNLFKAQQFWVFAATSNINLNIKGALTITGKLSGVTKFSATKNNGFLTSLGNSNGYTLIDLTNLSGQNYSNIVIDQLQITASGDIAYLALDAFTWIKDSNIVLNCPEFTSQPSSTTICAGNTTSFPSVVSNATGYQWQVNSGSGFVNVNNTAPYSGATSSTLTITGATAAMNGYKYQVIASGSCGSNTTSNETTLNVNSPPAIITHPTPISESTCVGGDTTFSVSASNATQYQWQVDQGNNVFTNISNNALYSDVNTATLKITRITSAMNGFKYRVLVKGACSPDVTSNSATLNVSYINVTPSQTDVLCNGTATGTATVTASGGTSHYTYLWSPSGGTGATATGLSVGNYDCLITDSNGCSITQSFSINEPAAVLSATQSQISATCSSRGQAAVSVSGGTAPYSYLWSPSGQTTSTAVNLAAGNHSVLITDGNGCTLTRTFNISTSNTLVAATSQTNILCSGTNTGSAAVIPSGAPGPFTYVWSPSVSNSDTAVGLSPGNYSVTITSSNGCFLVKNFTITESTAMNITPTQTNVTCNQGSNGSASVNVTGGTGPYTYSWAPSGGTNATASGLTAGTYTVTVKDANGCTKTQSFTITQPAALATSTSQTNVSCKNGSNGSATVNVTGGTGTYTYQWAPSGGTNATANGLAAGTYTVIIKDANSCQTTATVTITEPDQLTAAISKTDVSCNGADDGTATVTAAAGTGPYTYAWTPFGGTAPTATKLSPGTYTATIIDANGCFITQSVTINTTADVTAPIPNAVELEPITGYCSVLATQIPIPTATDNCAGIINATTIDALNYNTPGTYSITWKYDDGNGNITTQLQSVNVFESLTNAVTFSDSEFTYDGNPHSIQVENLPEGATVSYSANNRSVNAGTYPITATITPAASYPNCSPIVLNANLIINKTSLDIISNAQSKVYGSTDPELTYIASGFVTGDDSTIITGTLSRISGEKTGAYTINQGTINAGNNYIINYVDNKLTITPKLLSVIADAQTKVYGNSDPVFNYTATGFAKGDTNAIINGQLSRDAGENAGKYNIIQGNINAGTDYTIVFTGAEFEITKANQTITWNQDLEFGCDDSNVSTLTATTDSGLPVSYTIANSTIGTISGSTLTILNSGNTTITAIQNGDQNHNPAVIVVKPIEISQSGLVTQQWADVLFFDNKTNNFTAYQWYKNGNAVSGATRQYYSENQPLNGSYYVIAKDVQGNSIKSCPIETTGTAFSKSLKIHPNPVRPLSEFNLVCDFGQSQLNGAKITIFDITGKLVQTIANVKPQNQITAPSQVAIYVVVLTLNNGQKKTINLLVK